MGNLSWKCASRLSSLCPRRDDKKKHASFPSRFFILEAASKHGARKHWSLLFSCARLSLHSTVVPGALSTAKFLAPRDGQVVD